MNTRRYVVLRSIDRQTRSAGSSEPGATRTPLARGSAESGEESLAVESLDLSGADAADLERDPDTQAVALPMPMKLIEPVARSLGTANVDAGNNGAVAWGVEAVGAVDSTLDGEGVVVAVLDTGIDSAHPAFTGVTLDTKNFTRACDEDEDGHGTHCAATIFGRDVDGTRIGIARGVRRAKIAKVLGAGGGTSAQIAEAIMWAVNGGAHVVSMSLGIDFPGLVTQLVEEDGFAVAPATSLALEQYRANVNLFDKLAGHVAALGSFGRPVVIVAASGNESGRPAFQIAAAPPAAAPGIVSVGALERGPGGMSIAAFSNTQVRISAPGVDILSAVPGGGLGRMSGTSMATPHVAGVAALWAQKLRAPAGAPEARALTERVVGTGSLAPLAPGSTYSDVGTGIVRAPVG